MAARNTNRNEKPGHAIAVWRYGIAVVALTLGGMALVFAWQQFERFLIRDPAFVLPAPADYGEDSPNLRINGIHYASRARIARVFKQDLGRSIYLLPLAERRRELLQTPWVRDATITRIWPNQIAAGISERQPAAFLESRLEGISRWSLIDAEGVVMEPPAHIAFDLPVIKGVSTRESPAQRGVRVRRMLRLLHELSPEIRQKISEVDVADLDDLHVGMKMPDREVILMLGDRNFRGRIQNMLNHWDEIRRRAGGATVFDLRLDDRITVLGGRNG